MSDILKTYLKCSNCLQVYLIAEYVKVTNGVYKCKECGSKRLQYLWPSSPIRRLFKIIEKEKANSKEYGQISTVFYCSAIELLLEDLLRVVLFQERLYEEACDLVETMLDMNQSRSQMLRLFKNFTGETFSSKVKSLGKKGFMSRWEMIIDIRNNVAHGNLNGNIKVSDKEIMRGLQETLQVFSKLHNEFNRVSTYYIVATQK